MINNPSPQLLAWLIYEQSLTQKLKAASGDARLEVLEQRWELSDAWDQNTLNMDLSTVLHREILMWGLDTPCWYARTIIPDTTWQANRVLFDRLKKESLGQLIFNGTEIKRVSLMHYPITPSSIEYHWLNEAWHQAAPVLWVRLAEFVVNDHDSFFLVEILLPGLLRYMS